MVKSIYKITNKINGKCYIGQTNNIERRFKEHRAMRENNDGTSKLLYRAFQKYGIENFDFEVIEKDIENFDDREIYWINYYNSCGDNGYNIALGGSAPPILKGIDNPNTTHSIAQVQKVIKLLKETTLSSKEIGDKIGYDPTAIIRINNGTMWHDDSLNYPIRPELNDNYYLQRALLIIDDLQNTKMTQKEIAEKYGVGRSTITAINNGQNNKQPDIIYPIRGKKQNRQSKTVLMIDKNTKQVIKEFINAQEACKEVGVSRSAIQSCCVGNTKTSSGYIWKYKDD